MLANLSDNMINEDLTARQSRWGSLITGLEDKQNESDWDLEDDDNENTIAPGLSSKGAGMGMGFEMASSAGGRAPAWGLSETSTTLIPAFIKSPAFPQWPGGRGLGAPESSVCTHSLHNWITYRGRGRGGGDKKKYLEKSVRVLSSLAGKIVGEYKNREDSKSDSEDDIIVHPIFITVANVMVTEDGAELTGDFDESGDSIFFNESGEDEARKKCLAMNALGRIAYEMCMPEDGPSVLKFCSPKSSAITSASPSNNNTSLSTPQDEEVTALDEDDIMNMLRKIPCTTTSEEKDSSGLISAMVYANIPFPLCRFISDLLDDEHESGFRSEHSFSSFNDVLSDLKQMMDNPNDFLHASSPDRWKLVFGDKLYGRDGDTKAFMDAADRVVIIQDDPLFGSLLDLMGKRREVIMISGHSGAGKSRLVKSGGALLEKRGWRFLRCKFDRVVHPEPLSILAYAFEEYFGSFASCPKHGVKSTDSLLFPLSDLECSCSGGSQEILCQRLKCTISSEGLGILAKHIPSLHLVLDVTLPPSTIEVNESMMASLFRKLLQVISSKRSPILFFVDDLQWADPLSLALLTALVQGTSPELLHLSSTNDSKQNDSQDVDPEEEEIQIMFVGSYRDNEVHEDHPLAKVLRKFQSDSSINMTNISLSRFTFETLNEMLSESLCVPVRRVRSLSELMIQKTDGQPLHIIAFIQALSVDNLLTHSFVRGWEWDADSIDICSITDSVAELYAFKLKRLPKDILLGLQIVSCFGSQTDQHILSFVADYDDENSVDISAAIDTALGEGLIERAAQLISFTHDMIQKATIDSIQKDELVPLLRKLAAALIRNSSKACELESVLFVAVDLINRIGSDATSFPAEQALFAELNLRAGSKAITVPDFVGAAKYAENGIAFLSDDHWEAQYDLSLSLYETAVLSHFSSLDGDRNQLKKRINAVLEHSKDFSDQFKTHCVWIKVLAMTDLSRAIEESLIALERLGEPLDLVNVDSHSVCDELVKRKEEFSGERKKRFLSTNRCADCTKVRAMKIMTSLLLYYHQTKPFMSAFIACRMVEMSIKYGHCEESVFGAAGFAGALVTNLNDINEGSAWGRAALSLTKMYDKETIIPMLHGVIYGIVFSFQEPIQSTLEPLAQGIRSSFATGNVEFAMINTIYYTRRSFNTGKQIRLLTREVESLARQHGSHFGYDSSSDTPVYSPLLQFYLTPLHNILRELTGDEDCPEEKEPSFPLGKVKLVNNDDIMQAAQEKDQASFHIILSYQTLKAFVCRDMESALKFTDLYFEHFLTESGTNYRSICNEFYEALITFYFMRQTGEERYWVRGNNALCKIREWSVHSDWNFKNKLLLVEAEMYNTQKDYDKAASCYKASIRAAQEHKFIHEEAIAIELAGIFFLERGLHQISKSFFEHSVECYENWGATVVAKQIKDRIRDEFGTDYERPEAADDSIVPGDSSEHSSKKRQLIH